MSNNILSNENFLLKPMVSRRAFLLGGAAFLGGAVILLDGCRNVPVNGSDNQTPPQSAGAIRDISLEARPSEIEIAPNKRVTVWSYNGKFPGTEIRAKEGERLRIAVKNNLPEDTSIHWHGIQQKGSNKMDGIPGLTQPPIPVGGEFVYDFIVNAPGTYFYHPHSGLQIERGLSAPLIIESKKENLSYDREYTLVLDDWLAGSPDLAFEQLKQGISPADGLTGDSSQSSISDDEMMEMEHGGMSESGEGCCSNNDVVYSAYLLNGRAPEAAPQFQVKRGERVRFRVINAGGATVFRVAVQGHKLTVTHSDGFSLHPVKVDAFEISPGERYDFLLEATNPGAWAIVAAPTGEPERAARAVLQYSDAVTSSVPLDFLPNELRGKVLELSDLMSPDDLNFPPVGNQPDRQISLILSGSRRSYEWLINGSKGLDEPFEIRAGERVRVSMRNRSMMWHPMHLHGHSFRVLNGSNGRTAPVKDTVLVKPSMHGEVEFEFTADNPGEWLIHCHHAYHLAAGMERLIKYV